ncbi:MAG TPA: chemotaxis protein CheR, partial [Oceanicaulis sp.]|nr:chemotaxis protein CheR [Oceanicaulis sp.]
MSALPSNKFDFLCQDVRKRSGLVLGQEKAYLIDSRLGPLARKEGFASVEALIDAMMRGDQRICV